MSTTTTLLRGEAEAANPGTRRMFWYFGYGSNMDLNSLRAKGVAPRSSQPALVSHWRLRFNVRHFFSHEGGVGNIEPAPGANVWGVLHLCDDQHLAALDDAEAYGYGYDRALLRVRTAVGEQDALTYVGMPAFLDDRCLPTRRYLNILLQGARAAGLDAAYVAALARQPLHAPPLRPPYRAPAGEHPAFDAGTLARHPLHTALADAVFDMSAAQPRHFFLRQLFGGKDMTLFHLQRMDRSTGRETLDDIGAGRLDDAQRSCLNEYLHEYALEYRYAGRYLRARPAPCLQPAVQPLDGPHDSG